MSGGVYVSLSITSLDLHSYQPWAALGDYGILTLPSNFPNLTFLNISGSQVNIYALSEVVRKLNHITSLDLSNCSHITDDDVALLKEMRPNLKIKR